MPAHAMKVLMLSWEYPPHVIGGLGKHVTDLLPALANEKLAVSLLTPMLNHGAANQMLNASIHIMRVPLVQTLGHNFFSFVTQANGELEQAAHSLYTRCGGFDLIHNHDWLTAPVAIRLKQQWGIPLVSTIHATERGRWRGSLYSEHSQHINDIEQQLANESARLMVCSQYMARQIGEYFQTPGSKIDIVPNAVYPAPSPFTSQDERKAFRRRFADDNQYLGFFIGRVVYEKGLHVLLDAWTRLLGAVNARLVIAGVGPDLEDLKQRATALGLSQHVLFLGLVSDADRERLYHAADVAIFPSIYEPFGIVALEAMAAECPVVVTETGGLQEIVTAHETGIMVKPNHIDSLNWGILHTLQNPEWSRARALNALRDLDTIYSWPAIARQKAAIYRQVLREYHLQRVRADGAEGSEMWRAADELRFEQSVA
jgi:glycosyltransferase involved in cell wall biosynthesis